jgi:predicted Zn-dependent peptidase
VADQLWKTKLQISQRSYKMLKTLALLSISCCRTLPSFSRHRSSASKTTRRQLQKIQRQQMPKSGYFQSQQVNRAQDASLARTLASYLFWNRKLSWDAEFEKKLEALIAAQITAALRRHINSPRITIIKAGDLAKAKLK